MANAVDQAEVEDRVVLAQEAVGQPAAQEREEVDAEHEGVEDLLGGTLTLRLGHRFRDGEQQRRGDEELREDVAHPVERETLAALVADDVGDLFRQPAPRFR